jgi:acyl carrier protein
MNEKLEKLTELIKEHSDMEIDEVTEDSLLIADMGVDSIVMFEIIDALEEEYNIEIPDSKLEKLRTVGDLLELLG